MLHLSIQRLSDALGFTYSLRAPPESTTTTETVEMVRNGSADMTGSYITITAERSEYVSFTYPYFDLGIVFVYKPGFEEEVRKGGQKGRADGGAGGRTVNIRRE